MNFVHFSVHHSYMILKHEFNRVRSIEDAHAHAYSYKNKTQNKQKLIRYENIVTL